MSMIIWLMDIISCDGGGERVGSSLKPAGTKGDTTGGKRSRRSWSDEDKRRIVEEAVAPGASVADIARRYGVNANLLFNWRKAARAASSAASLCVHSDRRVWLCGGRRVGAGRRVIASGGGWRVVALCNATAPWPGGTAWRDRDRSGGRRALAGGCLRQRAGLAACSGGIEGDVMIQVAPGTKVYLACRPVSMRYGFDGLAAQAKRVVDGDPFSGHLFLFRSKSADYLKILYYDGTGLCLFAKRLESGKFVWPPIVEDAMVLTPAQLALLLEAIDWRRTVAVEPPRKPVVA